MSDQKDYVSVVYGEERTPRTDYPSKLTAYLFERCGMAKGDKLLEIGCGRGEFIQSFKNLGLDCYGMDRSSYSSNNIEGVPVAKVDVGKETFPFEDSTFDVVYHKSLLEHLYDPKHLMEETMRVLKPGGKLVTLTPDWVSQKDVFYEDFSHCRPYVVDTVKDLFAVHGLKHIQSEIFLQLPLIWSYPALKILTGPLSLVLPVTIARKMTSITGLKFFRFSVEKMIFGYGEK